MDKFIESGAKFDYVFSDLTDIPLSKVPQSAEWQFLLNIVDKSFALLNTTGQFLTHVRLFVEIFALKQLIDI